MNYQATARLLGRFVTTCRLAHPGYIRGALTAVIAIALIGQATAQTIKIGLSVPKNIGNQLVQLSVTQATRVLVDRINAGGGINGHRIELINLEYDGTHKAYVESIDRLLTQDQVLAILNCIGDEACKAAVPSLQKHNGILVGAISGAMELRLPPEGFVFPIRPAYDQEARKLALQLATIGASRAALLSDSEIATPKSETLVKALSSQNIQVEQLLTSAQTPQQLARLKPDALILDIAPYSVDTIEILNPRNQENLPPIIASLADPSLVLVVPSLRGRGRMLGFTTVVPNPEASSVILAELFRRDISDYPMSMNYLGFEAYLNASVLIEALQRINGIVNRATLRESLKGMRGVDVSGVLVTPGDNGDEAQNRVGLGVLSAAGILIE